MVSTRTAASKKKLSTGGGGKKKLSAFNRFMRSEITRLKDAEPNMTHQERFKLATANWKKAKEKAST